MLQCYLYLLFCYFQIKTSFIVKRQFSLINEATITLINNSLIINKCYGCYDTYFKRNINK